MTNSGHTPTGIPMNTHTHTRTQHATARRTSAGAGVAPRSHHPHDVPDGQLPDFHLHPTFGQAVADKVPVAVCEFLRCERGAVHVCRGEGS